jgi:DNA-binding transcriptional regulator YiaG
MNPLHIDPPSSADKFRRGRLGMGWSRDALARTIGVPPDTVRAWEDEEAAIPPKVLAWVQLYATAQQEQPELEMAA